MRCNRGARIRTGDLGHPKAARYQAAPRPVARSSLVRACSETVPFGPPADGRSGRRPRHSRAHNARRVPAHRVPRRSTAVSLLRPVLATALLAAALATLLAAVAPRARRRPRAPAPPPQGAPSADVAAHRRHRARSRPGAAVPAQPGASPPRPGPAAGERAARPRRGGPLDTDGAPPRLRARHAGRADPGRARAARGLPARWPADLARGEHRLGRRRPCERALDPARRGWPPPPHRANVLAPRFREIGIGIAVGRARPARSASPAATVTADFGRRGPRRR